MIKTANHIGFLVGRIFLIASNYSASNWHGIEEKIDGQIDYDSLENFISYEEGDLTPYINSSGQVYYTYFCMSSRVELFSFENGIIICDGLYFNQPLNYYENLLFKRIDTIDLNINIENEKIYFFDAAVDSSFLHFLNKENCIDLNLKSGTYHVHKVETTILIDIQEVKLKGIQLVLN